MGIQSVTGPSLSVTDTGITITGPAVLQIGATEFYISVPGLTGGGGGTSSTPAQTYDSLVKATSTLQNYWTLSDTTGTTAVDSVGGANGTYHGTVVLGSALPGSFTGVYCDGITAYVTAAPAFVAGTAPRRATRFVRAGTRYRDSQLCHDDGDLECRE